MVQKRKHNRVNSHILGLTVYLIIVLILSLMLFSLVNNKERTLFGYSIRVVVTGSMEPVIKVNSINIIKRCSIDDIKENDIVCFNSNSDVIHRVIEIVTLDSGEKILHTKGDANDNPDGIEINGEMLKGKVVYTFNGFASLVDKYSTSPGNIDGTLMAKDIVGYAVLFGLILFVVSWLIRFIVTLIKSLKSDKNFDDEIDKYIQDIDELILYRELLTSLKNYEIENSAETRMRFIANRLSKTKAEMEIRNLHYAIKDFKHSIKNCNYLNRFGTLLDSKDDKHKRSLADIVKYCKKDKV